MIDPVPAPPPRAAMLLGAAARLLRPLVRLLIRNGVTYPVLADHLRGLYVDVVLRDLLPPQARTDSRVSLLTGVHRKEIRRLRAEPTDTAAVPAVVTLSSQVIAGWLARPDTTDAAGQPRPLPRLAREDGAASFEGLVRAVTTDVRPRAVLDDWLDQGLVTLDEADRVVLNATAFIPRPGGEEQMFYFARNLHDHVAAASANVGAAGAAPFLDRSVHYDRLTPEAAARLEAAARGAAARMLVDVNRIGLELAQADAGTGTEPGTPTRRVNLGVFLYVEDEPDGAAA